MRRLGDPAFNRLGIRGQPWGLGNAAAAASAPAILCAVTRFAAPTSTGSQSITIPDLQGLTPKAVIFTATRAVTDGVAADHTQMSFGAATGPANQWVYSTLSENGVSPSDTGRDGDANSCILFHAPGDETTIIAQADFTTFIENGCTINWSLVDAAFFVTVTFFAGDDLSAHADNEALGNVLDNAVDITAPGFEPGLVIASVINNGAINNNGENTTHSVGFCSNDGAGGIVQRCIANNFRNNQAAAQSSAWSRNDCTVQGINSLGAADWRGDLGSFDALGFTCTTRDAGANFSALCYLALSFGGVASSWVGTHSSPTSTGNNSDTGPGFPPQLVMRLMSQVDTVNTQIISGDSSGTWGVSVMDADDAYAASVSDEDAANPTNSQSLNDDVAIELPDDDGTAGLTAAFVSFDAIGWTENYTAVKGTAGLMPALAVESV